MRSTSCAAPRASAAMSGSPSRRRSTSNTGCSKKPSSSACRSRSRSPGGSRFVTGGAGGIGAGDRRSGSSSEGACVVLADIDETSLDGDRRRIRKAFGKDAVAGVARRRHGRDGGRGRVPRRRRGLRRGRHRRRQRGHRLGCAVRGHVARALEPQHRHSRDRLFPRRARGLSHHEGPGARRQHRLRRLEERARRLGRRLGLLHGEGGGGASRALPRARRRAPRHPRQHGQSRRGAARLEDLAGRVARAARGLEQGRRDGARRSLPPALAVEALRLSRRTSPRRSTTSPPISRPRAPATSSTSTPATR